MGVFSRFERRLEGLVTGTFARVFRSAVQPVEIASALQRELDNSAQILSRESSLVPNDFAVELSASDYERLAPYSDKLSHELTEVINNHAATQRYAFTGPVAVTFEQRDDLSTGRFKVRSSAVAGVSPRPRQDQRRQDQRRPPQHPQPAPSGPPPAAGPPSAQPTAQQRPHPAEPPQSSPHPRVEPPYVEVNGVRHVLEPPGVVIGRGSDADLRITDPGVSRRHAEIRVEWNGRDYTVTVHDLGSTNATVVDGRRIDQVQVEDGSQILLGNTVLVLRRGGPGGEART